MGSVCDGRHKMMAKCTVDVIIAGRDRNKPQVGLIRGNLEECSTSSLTDGWCQVFVLQYVQERLQCLVMVLQTGTRDSVKGQAIVGCQRALLFGSFREATCCREVPCCVLILSASSVLASSKMSSCPFSPLPVTNQNKLTPV